MREAQWRITFPIAKAEQRADGMYLVGLASGPEVDAEGERMSPEAIERFAAQINEGHTPLVYRDAHKPDGVLRDLGWVTRAWITEKLHLGVEVRLDEENPASMYLWRSVRKGKQYGMSVAGKVLDFIDEYLPELGKSVRTYKNVVLTEISNTTRPAWTPSFGTVLSKAIDEAEAESNAEKSGENAPMETEQSVDEGLLDGQETTEAPAAEDTAKAEQAEEADAPEPVAEEAETEKAEAETEEAEAEETEKADSEDADETVEETLAKAGRPISAARGKRMLEIYQQMGSMLQELGLLAAEEDNAETAPAEKSVDGESAATTDEQPDETAVLKSKVEELEALVKELANAPRTVLPPVIERAEEQRENLWKTLSQLSPSERLRVGLAALHGERDLT